MEKEIEMVKSYLAIMENRFEDLIHIDFTVQENVLNGLISADWEEMDVV